MGDPLTRAEMLNWLCENVADWPTEGDIRFIDNARIPLGWFTDNSETVMPTVRSVDRLGTYIIYKRDYMHAKANYLNGGDAVDMVNAPPHYMLLPEQGVEVIHVREALLRKIPAGTDPVLVDHWSRAWEYLTRMWEKNGEEDARKAEWYLKRMLEGFDEGVPSVRQHASGEDQS